MPPRRGNRAEPANTDQPGGETADARCACRLYIPASLAGAPRGPDASAELIRFFDEHPAVPPVPVGAAVSGAWLGRNSSLSVFIGNNFLEKFC